MMRLADYLIRWTGDVTYADYWERNLYNGILAQQHPDTGMIAYFLPLEGAASYGAPPPKTSGAATARSCRRMPSTTRASTSKTIRDSSSRSTCRPRPHGNGKGTGLTITQTSDPQHAATPPRSWAIDIKVSCVQPSEFTLKLRIPWWVDGAEIAVNGETQLWQVAARFEALTAPGGEDTIRLILPKTLTAVPLPDDTQTVALMDGPVVWPAWWTKSAPSPVTRHRSKPCLPLITSASGPPGSKAIARGQSQLPPHSAARSPRATVYGCISQRSDRARHGYIRQQKRHPK